MSRLRVAKTSCEDCCHLSRQLEGAHLRTANMDTNLHEKIRISPAKADALAEFVAVWHLKGVATYTLMKEEKSRWQTSWKFSLKTADAARAAVKVVGEAPHGKTRQKASPRP